MTLRKQIFPILTITLILLGVILLLLLVNIVLPLQSEMTGILSLSLPATLFPADADLPPIGLQESESDLIVERARQQIEWNAQQARAVYQVNRLLDTDTATDIYLQVAGRVYTQPPPTRLEIEYADAGIYTCAEDEEALWCNYVGLYDDHVVTLAVTMDGQMSLTAFLAAVQFVDLQMGQYVNESDFQI